MALLLPNYNQSIQDTVLSVTPADTLYSSDSVVGLTTITDTARTIKKYTPEEIQSIFNAADRKQKEMDSILMVNRKRTISPYPGSLSKHDTAKISKENIPYLISDDSVAVISQKNFIKLLSKHYYYFKDTSQPVIYESPNTNVQSETSLQHLSTRSDNLTLRHTESQELHPDWLLGIAIGSLIVIAWLKLFYNKFFDQILQSIGNYQLSVKFFRDQNIFSRRVSLIMNMHFIVIGGLFFYLINRYFGIIRLFENGFYSFLFFSSCISAMLLARYLISYLVGYLFDTLDDLRGYIHHLLLIYKNLGIYLIPIVIGIAYIHEKLKIYVVYAGIVLFVLAYFLKFYKGIQIIIKKDVLIFYLILYLCTLEILPVLIIYKFLSDLI